MFSGQSQHQTEEHGERVSELDDRILEVTHSERQRDNRDKQTIKRELGDL
jgi:hypothetical protein